MSSRWIFVMILLSAIIGCGGKTPPPIVVGHVATLTGPDQRAGLQASLGISLALMEVNKDAERLIEVRHTDAQGKVDTFETQAIRLLAVSRVRALLGGDTPAEAARLDRAVQPETEDQSAFVPILSPCGWRTGSLSKQVIVTGMSPQAQAKVLTHFAVEEKNVARLLLLVDQTDDRARTLTECAVREFLEICRKQQPGKEPIKPRTLCYGGDAKLTDLLAQLGEDYPQAVLLAGRTADLRLVYEKVTQLRKSKVGQAEPKPILLYGGEDGSLRPGDLALAAKGDDANIYLVSAFGLEKDNVMIESFAQRFREQFKEEPGVHAALAYENMKLLAQPLRQSSNPDSPKKLREELFKIKDFPGLAGPLNFDSDQVVIRSLFVLRAEGEQMTVMKKYAP
jgi:branched-chain amino acid transport system substrate-binding protein